MAEKLKKLGGLGPYTYFMLNEMKTMQKGLDEIRRTLVAIKTSDEDQCIQSEEVLYFHFFLKHGNKCNNTVTLEHSVTGCNSVTGYCNIVTGSDSLSNTV